MTTLRRAAFLFSFLVCLAGSPTALFAQCGTDPTSGSTTISSTGPINSYYPGTGSPVAGSTSLTVGARDVRGAATVLAAGDLVVIMQMQGADINSSNSNVYGDGTASSPANGYLNTNLYAGLYEYNNVASVAGSVITLSYKLANSYYTQAFTASNAIRAYQVIRVPRYYDVTIAATFAVNAPAWNGSTGGVVVLDAVNTLNFAAATSSVTVAGMGFRGGGGKQLAGVHTGNTNGTSSIANTDYRWVSPVTFGPDSTGGCKGEGIAGSPAYIPNTSTQLTALNTVEGYIGGSMGRGAPANAGGGGTDGDPSQNQYNTGGGGGGNGGAGGNGGSGWDGGSGNAATYPYGGNGGSGFAQAAISRVVMGGGGGAGVANNSASTNEYFCSGASGGGIIIMRAKSYSGSGSVIADGAAAIDITSTSPATQTDAAGGGGAGGTIIIVTRQTGATGLGSITASAKGGKGANMTTYYAHGPGGGGGGGIIITNGTLGTTAITGGTNGLTHCCLSTTGALTDAYGSTAGTGGILVTLGYVPVLFNVSAPASTCGVLPVLLNSFNAIVAGPSTVSLRWNIEQAVNFKEFVVEHSVDGLQFSTIGTVMYSGGITNYSFAHTGVTSTVNYYRLRLMDNDDHFTYSAVLTVRISAADEERLSVFPNPSIRNVTVKIQAASAQVTDLLITDNNGRMVVHRQVSIVNGENFISLPEAERLPPGIYHLRVTIGGSAYTKKLVRE